MDFPFRELARHLVFALLLSAAAAAQSAPTHYTLPPDTLQKSKVLYQTETALAVVGTIWSLVVLIGVLRFGVGVRFRNLAESLTRLRIVQACIFVPLLLFAIAILQLPLELFGHHLGLVYGLSVQPWGAWMLDWLKAQALDIATASALAWIFYGLIRRSPRRWWFYAWLVTLPIILFLVFVAPVIVDPIFNKFEPLEKTDPALVQQLERVTERGGLRIPPDRMFEMKASAKVTTYNAYVTGFGATKRVVVWDNTARDLPTPEVMFIFGHEMGHYVLQHIWKGMGFAAALGLLLFYLGSSMSRTLVEQWGGRLEIRGLGDWASLPLLLLVFSVLLFFASPAMSGFSRHLEHQADIYGLEVIHGLVPNSPEVAAMSFQQLGENSLTYPYPNRLLVFWTFDHPPISDRLRFSLQYQPWAYGQQNKYVK